VTPNPLDTTATVDFLASTGTLDLPASENFTGQISGFTGQDAIDLQDIAFGSNTTLGYAPNSANTGGVLTVSNGTQTANLDLAGSYVTANFSISSDGSGGTLLVDPPVAAPAKCTVPDLTKAASHLNQLMASEFAPAPLSAAPQGLTAANEALNSMAIPRHG